MPRAAHDWRTWPNAEEAGTELSRLCQPTEHTPNSRRCHSVERPHAVARRETTQEIAEGSKLPLAARVRPPQKPAL